MAKIVGFRIVEINLDENNSITHDFIGKYGSANVLLKKAPEGTGIIAGGPARVVCELAGIKNIRTKSLGSNNKQNVVLATISGLSQIKAPEEVAKNRGKSVEEVLAYSRIFPLSWTGPTERSRDLWRTRAKDHSGKVHYRRCAEE